MRLVFMGTPEFAVPALQALLDHPQEYEVSAVFTQPDRRAGRGQRLTPPPVKVLAQREGVPVFQPERLRKNAEALEWLRNSAPELIVVAAFGQILPSEFFDLPRYGTLNIHASLLPKYRGASPIVAAILEGEQTTGVTIMKIAAGMDTGDLLSRRSVDIPCDMTAGELEARLSGEGAELLLETIPGYVSGEIQPRPQDDDKATYAPRIAKDDARLDWKESAQVLHNRIRAYNPWPGAFTGFRGETVKLWRSTVCGEGPDTGAAKPGQVVALLPDAVAVVCGDREVIRLTELQWPGRKRLPARDFANGTNLKVGELFT